MSKRVVLIGHPVAHSLSATMQQAAFDAAGLDVQYELLDRTPLQLAGAVEELRDEAYLGANVTIPHKERVAPLMDRVAEEAQATGAVNTVTREGKRLIGHNTDVGAFRVALDALVGRQKMPRTAVVLGAGGGARAVVHGLITEGFQRIIVFNRHLHRAENLVRFFGRGAAHMELQGDALARVGHRGRAGQGQGARQRVRGRPGHATSRRSRPSCCRRRCWSLTSSTRRARPACCAMPRPPAPPRR